ncbi:MAG: winged helix-turn-helix transcriptional regulator [Thermodesulfovibrionia bacterium]|nr:winged helix-turn-helix transcriptional regulator [Thermodesulfovibrionia bacterium]
MHDHAYMNIFKLLSDDTKLRILKFLLKESCCESICRIRDFVKKDHSVVLKDIQKLEKAGLIWTYKEGKFLRCGIRNYAKMKKLIKLAEEVENEGKEKRNLRKINGKS